MCEEKHSWLLKDKHLRVFTLMTMNKGYHTGHLQKAYTVQ